MTSNETLIEVKDEGWLQGFKPLWHKESKGWWGKWKWLGNILIWIMIVDGMLALVAFAVPKMEAAEAGGVISQAETGEMEESAEQTSLMVYFLFAAMAPAFGLIIFGHESIIDERKLGTAAWVLSKPVSRAAFLLSKLLADALEVLTISVLVQGVVAYFIFKAATGISLSIPGFLAGMGLIFLYLSFFLSLTLMLGTLFQSRGPVIGIPILFISTAYLPIFIPWLYKIMPSSLIMGLGSNRPSLAEILALGQPISTVTPIISTAFFVFLFIIVALLRFEREQF